MKKTDVKEEDELLPEYDLKSLRVRKFGPEREHFPRHGVVLEPDVAARCEHTRLADAQAAILGRKKKF